VPAIVLPAADSAPFCMLTRDTRPSRACRRIPLTFNTRITYYYPAYGVCCAGNHSVRTAIIRVPFNAAQDGAYCKRADRAAAATMLLLLRGFGQTNAAFAPCCSSSLLLTPCLRQRAVGVAFKHGTAASYGPITRQHCDAGGRRRVPGPACGERLPAATQCFACQRFVIAGSTAMEVYGIWRETLDAPRFLRCA